MTPPTSDHYSILVVEDDHDTAEFYELLLTMDGYRVTLAHGGRDGLARFRESRPAAVLLDHRLPDLLGVEVCRQMRAELGPHLPILMLTADGPMVDAQARGAGVTALLHKPFEPEQLLELLAAHLTP
jgi:DNA-binding response OmpR family regulator